MMRTSVYDALAAVCVPPGSSYPTDLARAIDAVEQDYPKAAEQLRDLERLLPKGDPLALEELFTRTFDVQPTTSLDTGSPLFVEDYKRGALLANLSREHTQAKNDCGAELADNLANVLRLLPRMVDTAIRDEFVHVLLGRAVQEMVREFEPGRLAAKEEIYQKHHKTIIETFDGETRLAYRHALGALVTVLKADFGLKVGLPVEQGSTFVSAVGAEMGIESCNSSCGVK